MKQKVSFEFMNLKNFITLLIVFVNVFARF